MHLSRRPVVPSLTVHILDFSSETTERNSTKLDRKQDLNVLYKVCVFGADRKNKMAALASDWLRHFRLLLWNHWTEFNETWQEARSQRPLPSLCFSGRSEKQDGRPGLWLAETFSTSPLKPLNGVQRKLDRKQDLNVLYQFVFSGRSEKQDGRPGLWLAETFLTSPLNRWMEFNETWQKSKISTSSTRFVFLGLIKKTRWPTWPLIDWDIFDFSSETAERNSTKLDRKQDLNVLYQVCVFRADRKNKMASLASDWAETFSTSPPKLLNGIQRNLTGSKISTSSTKFVFFGPIGKTIWPPWPLIGWDIFDFSSETAEQNSTKLDRKQDLNVLYQVCVLGADQKNKMAALASDWLRHFSTSPLKPLSGVQRNLTGSKISTSSTKFVFFGPIGKTRLPPWPLIGWDSLDISSETAWTEFNETWQEARSQCPLQSLCFSGLISKQKCPSLPISQRGGTLYSGARYVALWASCSSSQLKKHFGQLFNFRIFIKLFIHGVRKTSKFWGYICLININYLYFLSIRAFHCTNI